MATVSNNGIAVLNKEMKETFSNLNPSAKEFFPSAITKQNGNVRLSADAPVFDYPIKLSSDGSGNYRRRSNSYNRGGLKRSNERFSKAEMRDRIRRTVYVCHIDSTVTEDMLGSFFNNNCGDVQDCRVCGEPKSVLRFAFIEFVDEYGASAALELSGSIMLGHYPLRVLPSKTPILPVNKSFLPQSPSEEEMCRRTVYCTNIDKKATQNDVKDFFEKACGEVCRLRLLGDHLHNTQIAFIEFSETVSALAAMNCSGEVLGSLPIRVSQSKTPLRTSSPRALHLN